MHMRAPVDAIVFLVEEHLLIRQLFADFDQHPPGDPRRPEDIVAETFTVLRLHDQVEDEIFYPAVTDALSDHPKVKRFVEMASLVHGAIDEEVGQMEAIAPEDPSLGDRFRHLGRAVLSHVAEEERLFPLLRQRAIDLAHLGIQMAARRVALAVDLGVAAPGDTEAAQECEDARAAADRRDATVA
jgi:hypothetical protein